MTDLHTAARMPAMRDADMDGAWPLPVGPVAILDPEPAGTPETIYWRDAADEKPDAELTVLLETTDPDMPIAQGWWDGERWCLCESGGFAPEGSVLAWAVVSGRGNVEAKRLAEGKSAT